MVKNGYRLIPKFGKHTDYRNGIFDTPDLPTGLPDSTKVN